MPEFGSKSREKLKTCHNDLQLLFSEVIKDFDCSVICGHRNAKEQTEAFRAGKSEVIWPKSKHNQQPSLAVDVVPYPIDWNDLDRFYIFGGYVKKTAELMGIKIKWGGDFKSFFDGPHFELI
jgi:hypothetical protein